MILTSDRNFGHFLIANYQNMPICEFWDMMDFRPSTHTKFFKFMLRFYHLVHFSMKINFVLFYNYKLWITVSFWCVELLNLIQWLNWDFWYLSTCNSFIPIYLKLLKCNWVMVSYIYCSKMENFTARRFTTWPRDFPIFT